MNEQQYDSLWKDIKKARDKFFVHYDIDTSDFPVFPYLDKLVNICLEMRDIILQIITSENSHDQEFQEKIKHFVSYYTNDSFLSEIEGESNILENAVRAIKRQTR